MTIKSSKQDRQGARNVSEIERKYDKRFAQFLGLLDDARDHVNSVESGLQNDIEQTSTRLERTAEKVEAEAKRTTELGEDISQIKLTQDNITLQVESTEKGLEGAKTDISEIKLAQDNIMLGVAEATSKAENAQVAADANAKSLNEYATQVSGSLADLQNQIDGAIETWFYNYVPTTANAPASSWKTTEDKNKHLGDLFYIVDNADKGGLVYRWALVNGVYGWVLVEDTEVAKALETAAQAKDTADGKRRVFVTRPAPPYDVGDLWTDGTNLRVCVTARASGSYNAGDWGLATEYITETAAKALIKVAKDSIEMRVELTEKGLEGAKTDISKLEMVAGQVSVQAQRSEVVRSTYSFDINGSGNLVLTYDGDRPSYSINSSGELVLEYEGDTPPETWIGADGVLTTTDESAMVFSYVGTLTSTINADGTWGMWFDQNGEVVSSIRFDLATRKFVFDGDIVVGNDLRDDITKITNDTLSTTNVVAENLQVNAANILGTLTIGQLPDNVASKDDIPDGVSDEHITTITNKTLTTTDVIAKNLQVNAANILGTLTIGQIPSGVATTDYVTSQGYQNSSQVEKTITSKGYQTASQVTQITKDTVTTSYVNALGVKAGSVDAEDITGTTITGKTFKGATGEFSGVLTAGVGSSLGGFKTDENSIFKGYWSTSQKKTPDVFLCTGSSGSYTLGGYTSTGWVLGAGRYFGVLQDGRTYCSGGRFGGWNIGDITATDAGSQIYSGQALYSDSYTEGNDGYPTLKGATLRIALTPQYLILYGKNASGDDIAIKRQWSKIIANTA